MTRKEKQMLSTVDAIVDGIVSHKEHQQRFATEKLIQLQRDGVSGDVIDGVKARLRFLLGVEIV